jgi:hypothetical protein
VHQLSFRNAWYAASGYIELLSLPEMLGLLKLISVAQNSGTIRKLTTTARAISQIFAGQNGEFEF